MTAFAALLVVLAVCVAAGWLGRHVQTRIDPGRLDRLQDRRDREGVPTWRTRI